MKITTVRRQSVKVFVEDLRGYCLRCAREVDILTLAQAAEMLSIDQAKLEVLISRGVVHGIQTVSGSVAVCKESLWQRQLVQKTRAASQSESHWP